MRLPSALGLVLAIVLVLDVSSAEDTPAVSPLDVAYASSASLVERDLRCHERHLDRELVALDAVGFANQVAPRLSGHVIRIGEVGEPASLAEAMGTIVDGDTVLLRPGRDVLNLGWGRRGEPLADMAIVGSGAGNTMLLVVARRPVVSHRVRIEHCTVQMLGDSLAVSDSWLHLRDCVIVCAGASPDAVFKGRNAVVVLEDCVVRGEDKTTAFALADDSLVLARNVRFESCGALSERPLDALTLVDCTTSGWKGVGPGHPSGTFTRGTTILRAHDSVSFEHLTDDEAVIAAAAGEPRALDARSKRLVAALDLERSLPYWIGLAADARPAVRALAARKLRALAGDAVVGDGAPLGDRALDDLARGLDADDWTRREEASRALEAAGEQARPVLERLARAGSAEQRDRARGLLAALRDRAVTGVEVERGRLLDWLERTRERLAWDAAKKRWVERSTK